MMPDFWPSTLAIEIWQVLLCETLGLPVAEIDATQPLVVVPLVQYATGGCPPYSTSMSSMSMKPPPHGLRPVTLMNEAPPGIDQPFQFQLQSAGALQRAEPIRLWPASKNSMLASAVPE